MQKLKTVGEFEKALIIDEDDLDSALIEQATMYWWVGQRLVEEQSARDHVKADLEFQESIEAGRIRKEFEEVGGKITESQVKEEVTKKKSIRNLKEELRETVTEVAIWGRLEMSIAMRSKALTSLVHLRNTEYFSRPDRGGDNTMQERSHVARRKVIATHRKGER